MRLMQRFIRNLKRSLIVFVGRWLQSRVRKGPRRPRSRALVNEILSLQILLTAVIGILAIGGLFWTSEWVLHDNLGKWASKWTGELNELGAPLYLPEEEDVLLRVERFTEKYPEIKRVTAYQLDGSVMFSVGNEEGDSSPEAPLDVESLALLSKRAGTDTPYKLDDSFPGDFFQIRGPIWTESIPGDGLYYYDPDAPVDSSINIVGYVSLDLDFSWYHGQLVRNVWYASLALIVLLLLSGLVGRFLLKRALASLSGLQQPIAELAKGNLKVHFEPAAHREIAAIVDTLETTTAALRERDEMLSRLANHDALTGLFNRHRFVNELTQEIESVAYTGNRSALFFVDLDQFKYVNDTCGHPAGDQLLKLAAKQLCNSVRDEDIVARFGGDEFSILARDVSRRQAKTIANAILKDMRQLTHVEKGNVFHLQCSIGIAMINSNRFGPHELVAQADIACHEAKSRGRNRLEFYKVSANETQQMTVDVGWMRLIRQAIDEDAFVLHYQPIVHIKTGETTHQEVLLRMQTDDGRLIAPDAFLPAASRFGLMADVDRWLVDHALRELARYRQEKPDLKFALNISAHAFESQELAEEVRLLLNKYKLPPDQIIFEITEQGAMRHLIEVEMQIAELREMGCQFAIDDFGTGYSSFSHLKRLPVDYIKIDGSFIKDLDRDPVNQTMVRLIGEIGKAAGMKTIAEYVQNGTAMSLLAKFGVDYAQGYYIGRPTETPISKNTPIPIEGRRRQRSEKAKA